MSPLLRQLALLALLLPCWAAAAIFELTDDLSIEAANQRVLQLERQLKESLPFEQADSHWLEMSELRKASKSCIEQQQAVVEESNSSLQILGEEIKGEERTIRLARRAMQREQQNQEQLLARCKLLFVKVDSLLAQLSQQRKEVRTAELLERFPSLLSVPQELQTVIWPEQGLPGGVQVGSFGFEYPSASAWSILLSLSALAIAAGSWLRQRLLKMVAQPPQTESLISSLAHSLGRSLARFSVVIMLFATLTGFSLIYSLQQQVLLPMSVIALALLLLSTALWLGRSVFSPLSPSPFFLPLPEPLCRRFWVSLRFLVVVLLVGAMLHYVPLLQSPVDSLVVLLRAIYLLLLVPSLIGVVWQFFALLGKRGIGLARGLVVVTLVVALAAEFMGLRNLSAYLLRGVMLSLVMIGLGWLLAGLVSDFFDGVDAGRYRWQRQLHQSMGVVDGQYSPGLFWLRMVSIALVWIGVGLGLLRVWDVSAAEQALWFGYLSDGFPLGSLQIVPGRILLALVVLTLLLSLTSWFKIQLDERWLSRSPMDSGTRNAIVTVSGYVAAIVAILIALGVAGVEFGNLAIIAGALSVGIGFGLQNIVNNFVSGLILLFERPVRKGDWIVVGGTEGYVQQISIRSTQIRTFDRADVIVPNSELISSQVTNWMLHDLMGRVKVPIGVAYGSDVEQVKAILLKIGEGHPMTIMDGSVTKPKVFFFGFGDSSLNFELRFFIRNVDDRLTVLSDCNFAINREFNAAGIEIPFPQRVVHLQRDEGPPFIQ